MASHPTDLSAHAASLRAIDSDLDGRIILPADAEWDTARSVWNGMIDRQPIGVMRCASPADVGIGIAFAREQGLPLAVRGGGHNVAGNGTVDGGLVLDLSLLREVDVDTRRGIVRVGGGATLGDVDRATVEHGLVVPAGVVSGTGVAGLTLGGGMGWLTRAHGLTVDSLLAADLVTADGRSVRASATEQAELFWGIRGGGGNFGVVTSFEFAARPLGPDVYAGACYYTRDRWLDALQAYAEWAPSIPDDLTTIVTWLSPPDDWLPEHLRGQAMLALSFCWAGLDLAAGERAVADLLRAGPPDHVAAGPTSWLELQTSADAAFPHGIRAYFKSTYFDDLDEGTIATLVEHSSRRRSPMAGTDIHQLGGAFARVADEATAFGQRDAPYILNIWGVWQDPADDASEIAWVRDFWSAMQPHARGGHYVNFLGADDSREVRSQLREIYAPAIYDRLVALKDSWDPTNLFRLNHNVPPGGD
jgi:FAD/FMN-containing dehydrogenase